MAMYNFNRNRVQSELSDEQLNSIAPTIFADHYSQNLTDKYMQIKTIVLVNIMRENGWYPVSAQEVNTKAEHRIGFQKHMIQFAKKEGSGFMEIGQGIFPRAVLTNSHDGTSSYILMAGLWRQICSNGLVVSPSSFEEIRIKHVGFDPKNLIEASYKVLSSLPVLSNKIEQFQSIALSTPEQEIFAKSALIVKHGEEEKENLRTSSALWRRRSYDNANDLWTTYNVIQENLIKGGNQEIKYKNRTKEVKSIDKNISLNRALWNLTEEMAKIKLAA